MSCSTTYPWTKRILYDIPGIQMPQHYFAEYVDQRVVLKFIDADVIEMPCEPRRNRVTSTSRRTHGTHKLERYTKKKRYFRLEKILEKYIPVCQSIWLARLLFDRTKFHDRTIGVVILSAAVPRIFPLRACWCRRQILHIFLLLADHTHLEYIF